VRPPDDVIALSPVDVAPGAWTALESLARALVAAPFAVAARPVFDTRRGHPVLMRNTVLDAYRKMLDAPRPLRDVLASFGHRVVNVPVHEPRVISDLDTPDDVARWKPAVE
jgi:CTP:molybdopterin cytidylyltransferase MocA